MGPGRGVSPNSTLASGLREAKKTATREALRTAAVRLFLEKGFDEVSVDEVAAAAGVSRSTFFRYFTTKESVVFEEGDVSGRRFVEFLENRPPDESPIEAFEQALLDLTRSTSPDDRKENARLLEQLLEQDPRLHARRAAEIERWTLEIAETFARRGGRRSTWLEDRLAAGVCIRVTEELGREWRDVQGGLLAEEAIKIAFGALRALV